MAAQQQKHILVGTHHLEQVGGSELYTVDLLKALQRRGDVTVEYFALQRGKLAQYIEQSLGIRYKSRTRYDLILASHNVVVDALRKHGQIVQICHGTAPSLRLSSHRCMQTYTWESVRKYAATWPDLGIQADWY